MFGHHLADDYLLSSQRESNNIANGGGGDGGDNQQLLSQSIADFTISVTSSAPRPNGLTPSTSFSSAEDPVLRSSFGSPVHPTAALSLPLLHQSQSQGYWPPSANMPAFTSDEGLIYPTSIDINNTTPNILGVLPPINDSFQPFISTHPTISFFQMSHDHQHRQPDSQPNSQTTVPTCYSPSSYASSQPMPYLGSSQQQFSSQMHVDSQATSLSYAHSQPTAYYNSPQQQFSSQATSASLSYATSPSSYYGSSQQQFNSQATSTTLSYDGSQHLTMPATTGKHCANCGTNDSPTWRRHKSTQSHVCNACGLYYGLHKKNREFTVNARGQKVVKRQPRGSGNRSQKSKLHTRALELITSAPAQPNQFVSSMPNSAPVTSMEYMNASGYSLNVQVTSYIPSPRSEHHE